MGSVLLKEPLKLTDRYRVKLPVKCRGGDKILLQSRVFLAGVSLPIRLFIPCLLLCVNPRGKNQ